ncbi:hypothetical protein M8818_007384 [Zalaria obscura]|uniref:Uncharacterized protein n=1 Tax=Zalaria obscura TaxID=2024903 RepID=A0ACC3S462_9PEZI
MPRQVAPPPSGEFIVRLQKPFSGTPTHVVEVIGEPNRSASVKVTDQSSDNAITKKTGDCSADDVNELMSLISQLRGFPSHPSKDIYGLDTRLEFNSFEIQWASDEEDSVSDEVTAENKDTYKQVADSIAALGRTFAKKDAAI